MLDYEKILKVSIIPVLIDIRNLVQNMVNIVNTVKILISGPRGAST